MTLSIAVRRRLGNFALDVSFEAGDGITVLFGRSGSGKTTLVNLIAGLARPDHGRIAIGDHVLVDTERGIFLPPPARRIGYVFQEGRLFPHLSVRSNLLYGRWLTPRAARWGRLEDVVELLAIGSLLGRRPRDLSGGEKQRVAIGRALLASPQCLLMDEPLAALDRERKAEILPFIERLRDEMKLPIVYVSHAVEEVARLADTVVLIDGGRVAAIGPVGQVFAHLDGAGDWDVGAVLTARIVEQDEAGGVTRLDHPAGRLTVQKITGQIGDAVRVRIRDRDVTLAIGEPGRLSVRNRLAGTIVALDEKPGHDVAVRLDLAGAPMIARVTREAADELGLRSGLPVTALIKAVALDGR
ncbi:molybdenum ABC transporter ATP-binding protein [Kaistia dalseonensis]|uniref:Molybdate transport system ATP-binding protein n=1 Tax=Kaistia dalseonensis TaxID=410840 RepID=A0ABU0H5Y0_9HYPH|nr:molybdenum ABC transporter ATP-binding protein [Kaistia dalseonensis]MCX5495138.1 molybdenum ABC transporter ATP-binding protein [Kaistia dalseonensis]MDQ0437720.1 molybdate transport system ATP-binding protein [Kaistia dalseonensis]